MNQKRVTIAEGGGGSSGSRLVENVFLKAYGNDILNRLEDAAELTVNGSRIAFTTDGYTIKPAFFPGGDIGRLAICGTLNDLAVKGARPLALTAGFIIEEGFPRKDLETIAASMHSTASALGVQIVAGDTKVVGRGEADGIFITTAGIGTVMEGMDVSVSHARPGDDILVSGTIGDHGIAILNARENLEFSPPVMSDAAAIFPIVEKAALFGPSVHVMRDPTRGGVAGILNEIARSSNVTMTVYEDALPLARDVAACCELLGIDPLYMANEGKIVLVVDSGITDDLMGCVRALPIGKNIARIGSVGAARPEPGIPPVALQTGLGTKRFLPQLEGDPLPRIC